MAAKLNVFFIRFLNIKNNLTQIERMLFLSIESKVERQSPPKSNSFGEGGYLSDGNITERTGIDAATSGSPRSRRSIPSRLDLGLMLLGIGPALILIALIIVLSFQSPVFLTPRNVSSLFRTPAIGRTFFFSRASEATLHEPPPGLPADSG